MSAYETVVGLLYEVKDWGKEEALRDVLQWLEDNFYDYEDCNPFDFIEDTPYQCPVRCDFGHNSHSMEMLKKAGEEAIKRLTESTKNL